jgi:hypothetical protein
MRYHQFDIVRDNDLEALEATPTVTGTFVYRTLRANGTEGAIVTCEAVAGAPALFPLNTTDIVVLERDDNDFVPVRENGTYLVTYQEGNELTRIMVQAKAGDIIPGRIGEAMLVTTEKQADYLRPRIPLASQEDYIKDKVPIDYPRKLGSLMGRRVRTMAVRDLDTANESLNLDLIEPAEGHIGDWFLNGQINNLNFDRAPMYRINMVEDEEEEDDND